MTSNNITTAMNDMAPEVIYNVFSFLSYPEVYRIRGVCRKFQVMGEYHIYQQIKTLGQSISIKLDGKKKSNCTMELEAYQYDAKNRVIEFRPKSNSLLSLGSSASEWSAYYRLLKIHFSGWFSNNNSSLQIPSAVEKLSPQDQAMFLYHHQYNSSIEKTYELPSWHANHHQTADRFLGDKGLILNLSYRQSAFAEDIDYTNQQQMIGLPTSYYSYRSIASSTPMPSAPVMEIKWIRVTLDWVLLGMVKSNSPQGQIYEESFSTLNGLLAKEGCFKYDPLSEPVLNHIIHQQEVQEKQVLSEGLVRYVQSHTHECHTRLSRLQHMLEGAGVDAQVLWKYTFAKSFVVGNGSLLGEEDVVRRIQDSEEEWRQKKLSLSRRLSLYNSNTSSSL
ncbi:uncharacterized protein EV154DRAFT_517381 [Mucor mucedo]|uniref:uncharacterized protein n=1 Tax=Mucor mucedo TaxID=29922 RepID=UPI002220A5D8|nr:uncharacterized protein EV154DRAFT_517381 [Mucor mucedo]KAI7888562.1 hypothetical protein EV154DRAFT_517381 [Mucor mucedo]